MAAAGGPAATVGRRDPPRLVGPPTARLPTRDRQRLALRLGDSQGVLRAAGARAIAGDVGDRGGVCPALSGG